MTALTFLFAALALVLGALILAVIHSPRRAEFKVAALLFFAVILPIAYASALELLGQAKPTTMEWKTVQEATVLGSWLVEDDGIYLWLLLDETGKPLAYVLPWNRALAEQLQAARREADQNGTGLRVKMPFETSLDDGPPLFYALPQPMLPPKAVPPEPQIFEEEN